MELCLSNIAWDAAEDEAMYEFMAQNGITGLEIAPTRLFGERPYGELEAAAALGARLRERYGLRVMSMQSLWFGRGERLFGGEEERAALLDYTKQAIDLAAALGGANLVFGSPKNRVRGDAPSSIAVDFLRELAAYAAGRGCVVALEANPAEYGTDFVTKTADALALVAQINEPGLWVNLDFGTILVNGEAIALTPADVGRINHVHISEPFLAPVERRAAHAELRAQLERGGYKKSVSIEMKSTGDLGDIKRAALYLKEVFA